jgi:acyl carrier protein
MNYKTRLLRCFETVFPELSESEILNSSQESVKAWDSVATITLVNVIEDEFHVELDLDDIADLTTFDRVLKYVESKSERSTASS